MGSNFNRILQWLEAYKKKYYQNLLIKGVILSLALLLSIFLLFNSLEYTLRLSSPLRASLLVLFVVALLAVGWKLIITPLFKLLHIHKPLTHEEAALQIGAYFPNINDKLLNTIQLHNSSSVESSLIQASILQREKELSLFKFSEAVDLGKNKRYFKYLLPPLFIALLLFMFIPQLFTEGTVRIVNFNKQYIPEAPFEFRLQNNSLIAYKNEDFTIDLAFSGNFEPDVAYLTTGGRKIKMQKEADAFLHTFRNIQEDVTFQFEAAGFESSTYDIKVVSRPNLKSFNINLQYPSYLNKERERLENAGNIMVPEGTNVQWLFSSLDTDSLKLSFSGEDTTYTIEESGNQLFSFQKQIFNTDNYEVLLENENSKNKEPIRYTIDVIKDQFPKINLEAFNDTTLFNYMVLGGNISDDYGLTRLKVFYQIENVSDGKKPSQFKSFSIPISGGQPNQSYYFPWKTDSLELTAGSKINYFLQVWDNDGINGRKSSKTPLHTFSIPTKEEVKEKLEKSSNAVKEKINSSQEKAETLRESLEEIENALKGKRQLDWQDKQKIEELLKKKDELNQTLEELKKQADLNELQNNRFEGRSEEIKEKVQQLQKLMDEILDDETKQLYEELRKLLEEQKDANTIQSQIQKINSKENNLEKELERTLELFKRLQFDQQLENIIDKTEELQKEQEKLSETSEDTKKDEASSEEALEKQKALNKTFEELQREIDKLQDLNQKLENPNALQETNEEEQEVKEAQEKSTESLEKNRTKNAAKNQKKAAEKMQELGKKMEQMQSGMEMSMMQENLDYLRDILDNLIKLSFDQEDVMAAFKKVNQTDPRFVNLSQEQLKLKDDAKIIQDSLLSLANRVFQIQSFVTREVEAMNNYMIGSIDALKERNQAKAVSEQQFAMTSMNNLALLLNDVLKQMQQQMADAMGKPQKGQGSKNMGLSELQQQLNDKISELKKSGKSGRALSEELAKLAAEQEQIRQALQKQLQQSGQKTGKEGGGSGKRIIEKMEETEADLVNKELTQETIERQKDILTRLLESENAMREREQDEKREAEQASSYEQIVPSAFEDYIKAKEKEIELLKTIPPKLNPYYLQEVDDYFRRIKSTNH